jgi:hypothetical protein
MIRAHQPGSQPLDIPEAIPNPAVPKPTPAPSPAPSEPVKVPAPQRAVAAAGNDLPAVAPPVAHGRGRLPLSRAA